MFPFKSQFCSVLFVSLCNIYDPLDGDDLYLYLDRDAVVHIPTFKQLPCTTNPGGKPKFEPTARSGAVVGYKGQDRLMLCGGYQRYGCQVWTETGWQDVEGDFKRYFQSSNLTSTQPNVA